MVAFDLIKRYWYNPLGQLAVLSIYISLVGVISV